MPRLLVVGDVQSNARSLLGLLEEAGYATCDGEKGAVWTGGRAVVLLLGDLVDGGLEPAEVLVAVMSLEAQAEAAGGQLIVLKGNHEQMMLAALKARGEAQRERLAGWFGQGGLETLIRLAASRGAEIPDELISAMFIAAFGDLEPLSEPISRLVAFVSHEWRAEIEFLERRTTAAALVNGCVLGVHAAPNFDADGLAGFVRHDADAHRVAWDREWLRDWPHEAHTLAQRLAALKRVLDQQEAGVCIRHIVYAHTVKEEFRVAGFAKGKQYRVGRLIAPDSAGDVPGVYSVITMPREAARGGALGGLEFSPAGIVAVYGRPAVDEGGDWARREVLAPPDPAFRV